MSIFDPSALPEGIAWTWVAAAAPIGQEAGARLRAF